MSVSEIVALFLIAFVFVITPGPGTLAVFAKSISQGFLPAFYLSIGMVFGDLIYLSAVIFSLEIFAEQIIPIMDYVRVLGGLYLIYLGIKTWLARHVELVERSTKKANIKEFATGLIISLANPKVMVFYIAILPAFIELTNVNLLYALQVLAVVGLGLLVGISLINIGVVNIKSLFANSAMEQRINKLIAIVMITAGVLLGLS